MLILASSAARQIDNTVNRISGSGDTSTVLWLARIVGFLAYVTKLKSPNCGMDKSFNVSAPPIFLTEFSNKLERLNIKLVAV